MLELSKIHLTERYDPLTLFSACRRFFYLEAVEHEATQELFDYLSSVTAEKDLFAKGTAFLLAQTRYITEVAEAALSAALPRAQSAEGLLKHFIKSERGHDRLFARALNSMGTHVDTTPHSSTIVLMETLQTIAKTNFLAFAFALSLFERADFANVQKLSSVLSGGGLHAAASVVEIHDALNEQGNHDAIGLKLLNAMAPVSFSYAKSAILWAEYIAFLINTHSRSLLTAIRSVAAGAA